MGRLHAARWWWWWWWWWQLRPGESTRKAVADVTCDPARATVGAQRCDWRREKLASPPKGPPRALVARAPERAVAAVGGQAPQPRPHPRQAARQPLRPRRCLPKVPCQQQQELPAGSQWVYCLPPQELVVQATWG